MTGDPTLSDNDRRSSRIACRLTAVERRALGELVSALDCSRVRVYRHDVGVSGALRRFVLWLSAHRAIALGNHIFLPDHRAADLPTLAHELTHCAQYQAWGPLRYYGRAVVERLREVTHKVTGVGGDPYRYDACPAMSFERYGMEQQGQIVEDSFRGDAFACRLSPFRPPSDPAV